MILLARERPVIPVSDSMTHSMSSKLYSSVMVVTQLHAQKVMGVVFKGAVLGY